MIFVEFASETSENQRQGHEQVFLKPDLVFNLKGDITVNTPLRSITLQFTFVFFWLHLMHVCI